MDETEMVEQASPANNIYRTVGTVELERMLFQIFCELSSRIRTEFSHSEINDHLTMSMQAIGYPMQGDMAISAEFGGGYGKSVTATSFTTAAHEYKRRFHFEKLNKPLMLPKA